MFGFSKSLKSLNMQQAVVTKNIPTGPKQRFTQVLQSDYNRVIKKPKTNKNN